MSTELRSHLDAFIAAADEGSFSAAARRLGLTPAAVSKSVAQFEARLGVRLFQRSTRSLALTTDGEPVEGIVDRVTIIDGSPTIHIGSFSVPITNVSQIRQNGIS